jgi:minor extracellular serine protease Vpr
VKDDPSAEASTNAVWSGVTVVAASGNNGNNPYLTSTPASGEGAISVAANDPSAGNPGATLTLPSGPPIPAIDANGFPLPASATYNIKVLTGANALGCSVAAYGGPLPPNTLVVTTRGTCARVARAIFGQQAGAAAVVMVNNATGLPPFEGPITSNPDDGIPFNVTIPFLGVAGTNSASDGGRLKAANGGTTTETPAFIPNPLFTAIASFSSAGPVTGSSSLKPELTAPGVSIVSTAMGTGNQSQVDSGTSMATPMVAGSAILTRQAHPTWSTEHIKSALVNTGSPAGVFGYRPILAGTGLVQPAASTKTQVVVTMEANGDLLAGSLNFGLQEFRDDYLGSKTFTLHNNGATPASFNIARVRTSGVPHVGTLSTSAVTVPAGGSANVSLTLSVPVVTAGLSNGAGLSFQEVAGIIELTPASPADNAGVTLRVPYYLVPRAMTDIYVTFDKFTVKNPTQVANITNTRAHIPGDADFYAWGLNDGQKELNGGKKTTGSWDVRAIGVQSFPFTATEQLMVFAVNTWYPWSNPSQNEFDIYVDVDGDGIDDYVIVGADQGAVQTGTSNGVMGSFVFSTRSGGASLAFLAQAPSDSSTLLLPVRSAQLCRAGEPCLSAANPRITYHAFGFDNLASNVDVVDGSAKFNAWTNAISTGAFTTVPPGGVDTSVSVSVNMVEWAKTPALGLMIVTLDMQGGSDEALLLKVPTPK